MKTVRHTMAVLFVLALGFEASAQYRIQSEGVLDHRTPLAVPPFAFSPGLDGVARQLHQAMVYDLDFSGFFAVLLPEEYPIDVRPHTADAARIDFAPWRKTNVEYLVYVYIFEQRGKITAHCRLFEVLSGRQEVGQKLSVEKRYPRALAHRFADEITRVLIGTAGIASTEVCFSLGETGHKEIYVADYDGANLKKITNHGCVSILPKLSPDGRKIAYLSYKDRYPYLYVRDRDSGRTWPLSKQVGLNTSPAWAPDGKRLAIVLSKDGNIEIYYVNANGTGLRRLTWGKAADTSPTFDPTGKRMAFVSDQTGRPQIFTMDTQGKNKKRISYQGGSSYDPEWSPDGKHIAYVVEKGGEGREIYVMDADGRNYRRLSQSYGSNESPSWSADSRHVIFASSRTREPSLWSVNIETGQERRVPRLPLHCQGPSWGPRRK